VSRTEDECLSTGCTPLGAFGRIIARANVGAVTMACSLVLGTVHVPLLPHPKYTRKQGVRAELVRLRECE
jgi:hypothetical protein